MSLGSVVNLEALPYRDEVDSVLGVTLGENLLVVLDLFVSTASFRKSRLEEYLGVFDLSVSDRLEDERFLWDDLPSLPMAVKLLVEEEEYFEGVLLVSPEVLCNSLEDPYLFRLLVDGEAVLDKFLLFM